MNPSRGLLAAVLWTLLHAAAGAQSAPPGGSCTGRGGAAAAAIVDGPAFDLCQEPLAPEVLELWRRAGYTVDASSTHLLSPSGRPIPAAEFRRLSAPFDAAEDTMTNAAWSSLIFTGYRLQESTCRLLDPEKRAPLTRIDILAFERSLREVGGFSAVEAIVIALRRGDRAEDVRTSMSGLVHREGVLPEDLRRALLDRSSSKSQILALAEDAYARALHEWDGSRDLKTLVDATRPLVAGGGIPVSRKGRVEAWEPLVGDVLSSAVQTRLSRTEAGRELLGRFQDAQGRPSLPKMTVLKFTQHPDDAGYGQAIAVYEPSSRTVILGHWFVVGQILSGAPPSERARLGAHLSDPWALAVYLRTHPAVRAAVADRVDVTVFHELTHAWQMGRQALVAESFRGNAPGGLLLEREYEAYFGEYRYFHEKLMNDPSLALRDERYDAYLSVLGEPGMFRDRIESLYLSNFAGSTDFPTIEQVQSARKSVHGVPTWPGLIGRVRALLVMAGMARGDAALAQARAEQEGKVEAYLGKLFPEMRAESVRRLPDALARLGRPDMSLRMLMVAHGWGGADRRPEFAEATAALLARRSDALRLEERLSTYSTLKAELNRQGKEVPRNVAAAYGRDALEYAVQIADKAEAAGDPTRRRNQVKWARSWLESVPSDLPGARRLKQRLDALEPRR